MNIQTVLESPFFDLGKKPLTPKQLETYARIWWQIQPEFTIGVLTLLVKVGGHILEELDNGNVDGEEKWKAIFAWQAPAVCDEMGLNRDPYGLMHHDLFIEQVCTTTSLTREQLITDPLIYPNSDNLKWKVRRSFNNGSVIHGLCMMYVVETIAPQLFTAQKNIFLAAGAPLEKLRHSRLHEELEKTHAEEAEQFLSLLESIADPEDNIQKHVETYASYWKLFLDEVHDVVMAS